MCLFPEVGYRLVWDKLTAPLVRMPVISPTAKALRDLRRRLGVAPVRALFEVLVGPLAQPTTPGVRFGPYRTVSFDCCSSQRVPESARNRAWLGRTSHHGYPTVELMTLVETGTRALIGAVFGPTAEGETGYASRLLHLLRPDMLVLWDKGFDGNDFLAAVAATRAQVLGRLRSNRRTPVLARLADGSYLSVIGTVRVRIVLALLFGVDRSTITRAVRHGAEVTPTATGPGPTSSRSSRHMAHPALWLTPAPTAPPERRGGSRSGRGGRRSQAATGRRPWRGRPA